MQNARRCDQVFAQRILKCSVRSSADPVDDPSSRWFHEKYSSPKRNECHSRNRKWFKFSNDHDHRFGSCDQKQHRSRWNPCTDRNHRATSYRDHSSCSYLSAGRDHDPTHIRQKDHRSDGCSHSKWKINAFDDLYDGTVIYPVRGIDRIFNQR